MSGPVPTFQREHFSISRASEYFTVDGLQKETGQPANQFRHVALKELIDNALDAAETAGVAPVVSVDFAESGNGLILTVADNGPGIPPAIVKRILDFTTRTSDKAAYRAPTRGAQGNAIKTVLGIPVALGDERGRLCIEACGIRHDIESWLTPVGDKHDHRQTPVETTGTRITIAIPGPLDCYYWRPSPPCKARTTGYAPNWLPCGPNWRKPASASASPAPPRRYRAINGGGWFNWFIPTNMAGAKRR